MPSPNRQQTIDTVTTPLIYGQSIEPNAMYVIAPLLQPEKVDEIDAVDQYATTVFQDDINPISFWIKEADDEGRPCLSRLVLNYLTIPASLSRSAFFLLYHSLGCGSCYQQIRHRINSSTSLRQQTLYKK